MRAALLFLLFTFSLHGQTFTQRGFLETTAIAYPQNAVDDSGHLVGEALFRYEAFYQPISGLRFAGAIDARADTHQETERSLDLSWWDRGRQRPAFAIRRLSVTYTRGKLTFEAGKQFIRWGKVDVLNPTDRFAPRDFVNVIDTDFLGITAARLTYGTQSDTIDLVFSPRLTPSRVPLLNQRWAVLPQGIPIYEFAPDLPGGPQYGARWNHIGHIAEYSLSFYNGFDNLPLYRAEPNFGLLRADVQRYYPQMRMYGADAAIPLGPVSLKAEAGYFTSTTPETDEYLLYVLQLERQAGEWSFVGGYAGEVVTAHGNSLAFSPQRGFARSFVGRAGYTIDTNRSLALETVIRQNGNGFLIKPEYTQSIGQHWRVTAGIAVIAGGAGDFIGEYHRNSHGILTVRYSF